MTTGPDETASMVDLSAVPPRKYTFAEVRSLVEAVARGLSQLGLDAQSRIALVGRNSIPYFATFLGIREAGMVAVPIHWRFSEAQRREILKDANVTMTIDNFDSGFKQLLKFDSEPLKSGIDDPNVPAFIIYTSGSSGKPKGVVISHRSRRAFIVANAVSSAKNPDGRSLVATPLSHVLALNILEPLYVSQRSFVLMPKFDVSPFLEAVEKYRITTLSLVPSMMAMLLKEGPRLESTDLSSVKHLFFSSAPLTPKLLEAAQRHFPNAAIENCYGISEAGPNLFGPHPEGLPRPGVSVGFPRKGNLYRLVDGELEIKTPFMLNQYHNNPDLNSSALTADGYYKTRDKFMVDENGFYLFNGRADDMMICGGENIYPREIIEILEKHPAVASCAVVSLPDEVKGEKPYAFVVLARGANANEEELKQFMLENGPSYLHPRRIWFLDSMPLNDNMKIDLTELKRRANLDRERDP